MIVSFGKARNEDILQLNRLLLASKNFMFKQGITQWNTRYPSEENIKTDIFKGKLYVLRDETSKIQCAGSITLANESETIKVYQLQRIMTNPLESGKGLASRLIQEMEELAKLNKINKLNSSTSKKNIMMQKTFKKNNFVKIGEFFDPTREVAGEFFKYHKLLR